MNTRRIVVFLLAIAGLVVAPQGAAQSVPDAPSASRTAAVATQTQPAAYVRPTHQTRLHNYLFDVAGPYPIAAAALVAGINQADYTPPEWKQGAEGYGKRFISNFGIATISTSTRYVLAEALHEDTLYYRCSCKGFFSRLTYATFSTFTSRRGDEGHRVFSVPALVAPYAGTMTAVYAWFPERYNAKDGFRMGNYAMLANVGGNIALEFLNSGPHSLLARMHLKNGRGAPDRDSKP
jgi:hypothetical protein